MSRNHRRRALSVLLEDLDYYVESVMVHTCKRRADVYWLLDAAERDVLWLLSSWSASGPQGAEKSQDV